MGTLAAHGGQVNNFMLTADQFIFRDTTPKPSARHFGNSSTNALSDTVFGTSAPSSPATSGVNQYFETYQYVPAGTYRVSMIVNLYTDRVNPLVVKIDNVQIGSISLNNANQYAFPWNLTFGSSWVNETSSIKKITLSTTDTTAGRFIIFQAMFFTQMV